MSDILTPKMHNAQIAYSIREVNAFGYVSTAAQAAIED